MGTTYKVIVDDYGNTFWHNEKDQYHRANDLSAIEWADGGKELYVNGINVTEKKAKRLAKVSNSCDGKQVTIDGKTYTLVEVK